jgi:uncharacterized protein YecE (DUF72 family)
MKGPQVMAKQGKVRVGIGGWTFEPWRGTFYPKGLPHAQELTYASSHLTSIEINGTFYRTQTPETFAKWARETPEGFVFSVKGPRYVVQRSELATAGDSVKRFLDSGVEELGSRLGPLLWQFAPTKKFDAADFGNFLELLPATLAARPLRHVVEVRNETFQTASFIKLLRDFSIPVVFADHAKYPALADPIGDFVYARLQMGEDNIETAYPADELDMWADRARTWALGSVPEDLPRADPGHRVKERARDVFVYFIHEGKVRAPAAALALIERLSMRR